MKPAALMGVILIILGVVALAYWLERSRVVVVEKGKKP